MATRRTTAGAEWRTFDGLRLDGDGDRGDASAAATCRSRPPLADVLEVIDAERFRLLGRSQRPRQRRRQAQLARPPELPPQRDRRRRRRRVLDAARSDAGAAGVVRLVAFVVAPRLSARADRRRAARARRRGLPAAPHRPGRRAAARADRQADRRARLAALAAAHGAGSDARGDDATMDAPSPSGSTIAADHPAFAGHFPGRPLLPGVALLAEVLEAAARRAGAGRVRSARRRGSRSSSSSRRSARRGARRSRFGSTRDRARFECRDGARGRDGRHAASSPAPTLDAAA